MSEELKKSLSQFVDDIAGNVKSLLDDYKSDRMKAKSLWQKMSLHLTNARKNGGKSNILAGKKAFTAQQPSINTSTKPKQNKIQKKKVELVED